MPHELHDLCSCPCMQSQIILNFQLFDNTHSKSITNRRFKTAPLHLSCEHPFLHRKAFLVHAPVGDPFFPGEPFGNIPHTQCVIMEQ